MTVTGGVSLRTRFERFPATVKGAFVLRGEDTDPHQVRVRGASVVRLPAGAERDVPMEAVTVDVPPHQDVFVPFELPIGELEPGWYGFRVDVEVDGSPRAVRGDRRFAIGWPRGAVRTGTVKVERDMALGPGTVRVDRVQCTSDSTTVRFVLSGPSADPADLGLELQADGAVLDVVAVQVGSNGDGVGTAYPTPRAARTLRVTFALGGERAEVRVPLS